MTRTVWCICSLFIGIAAFDAPFIDGDYWHNQQLNPLGQEWIHIHNVVWIYRYSLKENQWIIGSPYWFNVSAFWDHRVRSSVKSYSGDTVDLSPNILGEPPYIRVLLTGPYDEEFVYQLQNAKCEYYDDPRVSPISASLSQIYVSFVEDHYPENLARPYHVYCGRPPDLFPHSMSLSIPGYSNLKDVSGKRQKWIFPIRGTHNATAFHETYRDEAPSAITSKPNRLRNEEGDESAGMSRQHRRRSLMICVKPFRDGVYKDLQSIIDFLVFYDAMGADHFELFDAGSIAPRVKNAFQPNTSMDTLYSLSPSLSLSLSCSSC